MSQGVLNEIIDMMKELNEMVKMLNACVKDLDNRVTSVEKILMGPTKEKDNYAHSKYYYDLDRNL